MNVELDLRLITGLVSKNALMLKDVLNVMNLVALYA